MSDIEILQQLSEMLIAQEFDCMLKVPKNGSFGGSYGLMTALNGDILTLVSCRGIPVLSQYALMCCNTSLTSFRYVLARRTSDGLGPRSSL